MNHHHAQTDRPQTEEQEAEDQPIEADQDAAKNATAIIEIRELLFGEEMGAVEDNIRKTQEQLVTNIAKLQEELLAARQLHEEMLKEAVVGQETLRREAIAGLKAEILNELRTVKQSAGSSIDNLAANYLPKAQMAEVLEASARALRAGSDPQEP